MGMVSAAKQKAPNATTCFLSSKIRSQKNTTVEYLDSLDPERQHQVLKAAIPLARKQTRLRRKKQCDLRVELSKRQATKRQARDSAERRKLEKRLKSMDPTTVHVEFAELEESKRTQLVDVLTGKMVRRTVCHVWSQDGANVMYNGKKLKPKTGKYTVAYWAPDSSYDDATDYGMSMYELAADLIHDDLLIS